MSTFTREDLNNIYTKGVEKNKEKKIQEYVAIIKDQIFKLNERGYKTYVHCFYKGSMNDEKPDTIKEIVRRLKEIFVDIDIIFQEQSKNENQIVINWQQ